MKNHNYIVLEVSYKDLSYFKNNILELTLFDIITDVITGSVALFDASRNNIIYLEKIGVIHFLMELEENIYVAYKNNHTTTYLTDDYQRFQRIELFCNNHFIYIKNDEIENPISIKYNLLLQDLIREKRNIYAMLEHTIPNLSKHKDFYILEKFLLS